MLSNAYIGSQRWDKGIALEEAYSLLRRKSGSPYLVLSQLYPSPKK
ncbi:MAG: hypothetical protein ACLT63_00610 [Bacteroides xylanisolvens]